MNNFQMRLEEILISCIDGGSIDLDVAKNLNNRANTLLVLEEMLISCVDSGTVEEDVAMNLLNQLGA